MSPRPPGALPPGWTLGALLGPVADAPGASTQRWDPNLSVRGLAVDSRAVEPGFVFFARPGVQRNGVDFAAEAIAAGAVAIVAPRGAPGAFAVPTLRVPDVGEVLGESADRYFRAPSAALRVVGVTGTNGKTSVTHYVAGALSEVVGPCALVGTLGGGIFPALAAQSHTTPDVLDVHRSLRRFVDAGALSAVMEVSSHGLAQGRVAGVRFAVAAFTNLSRDHLDYHDDEAAYAAAKRSLLEWPGLQAAVVNADDAFGASLLGQLEAPTLACSLAGAEASVPASRAGGGGDRLLARLQHADATGMVLEVRWGAGAGTLRSPLVGRFNAANLLVALGVLLALEVDLDHALAALSRARAASGRMETVCGGGPGAPTVVVDYAHTPDALAAALGALRGTCAGTLWCVFGCGGDRDPGKRPLMGRAAQTGADRVVVTSDNPRSEAPLAIIDDVLAGTESGPGLQVEPDRARAIELAIAGAGAGDVVLVAGKGHETHQILGDRTVAFDDRSVARAVLEARR